MFCSKVTPTRVGLGGGLSTFCWAVSAPNPYPKKFDKWSKLKGGFFPSDSLTSTLNLCCGGQFPWCFTLDFFDSSLVEIGAFQHISLPFNVIIMRSILYHRIDLWNRGLCEFVNRFWYHFSKKSGSLELVEEKVWTTMILHNGGRVQTLLTCMV